MTHWKIMSGSLFGMREGHFLLFLGSSHCRVSCDSKMATWNTWGRSEKRARWDGPTWFDHVSDHFFEIHVHNHWPKILKDWKIPPKLDPNLRGFQPDHSHGPNMAKLETLGPLRQKWRRPTRKRLAPWSVQAPGFDLVMSSLLGS